VKIFNRSYRTAVFGRTERNAVGDHFGWHPSAGPDVDERHGHVFEKNLMVADEEFDGPLMQFFQSPAVRGRLKDPQVDALDGNVYVRRAGVKQQPLPNAIRDLLRRKDNTAVFTGAYSPQP
jgi:hypothetical protein